jgi:hypothetical protein
MDITSMDIYIGNDKGNKTPIMSTHKVVLHGSQRDLL